MQCPRCGHEAVGMARACPSCGYMLPFSLRQHRELRDNPPETTRLNRPIGDIVPGAGGSSSAPSAPHNGRSPSAPSQPSTSSPSPAPTSWPTTSQPGTGTPGDTRLPDWLMPAVSQGGGGTFGPAPQGPGQSPATWEPLGGQPGRQLGGPQGGRWMRTGAPDPTADPDQFEASNAQGYASSDLIGGNGRMAPLDAGTLLKGSRYRLVERFSAPSLAAQQGETEPPLFLASDSERPGLRVLVQELPIADLPDGAGDQVQRRVISRLEMFGRNPALPHLVDSFSERRRRFLVFELPPGEPFPEYQQAAGKLSEAKVVRIAIQLLDALALVQNATPPLVHGNIAPGNILVDTSATPVLIGFSAALLAQSAGSGQAGEAGGAYGFAAPEQLSGRADPRTDIFSLAAVLHWAITGREPREAIGGAVESARRINPAVTQAFDGLLSRALQPDPARRFQSAAEMRQAIAALLEHGLDMDDDAEAGRSGRRQKPKEQRKPPKEVKLTRAQKKAVAAAQAAQMRAQAQAAQQQAQAAQVQAPAQADPAPTSKKLSGRAAARARDLEQAKTRMMLPGAAGALRESFAKHPPRRGGKTRRPRPFMRFMLTVLVLAGGVADGYFYLVHIHSPLLRLLPKIPLQHLIHLIHL